MRLRVVDPCSVFPPQHLQHGVPEQQMALPGQHRTLRLLLLALVATTCAANRGRGGRGPGGSGIAESGESELKPRLGTHCQLLSREVLTAADATTTPPTWPCTDSDSRSPPPFARPAAAMARAGCSMCESRRLMPTARCSCGRTRRTCTPPTRRSTWWSRRTRAACRRNCARCRWMRTPTCLRSVRSTGGATRSAWAWCASAWGSPSAWALRRRCSKRGARWLAGSRTKEPRTRRSADRV